MDILDDELNGIAGDDFENFGYSHHVVHVLNDENLNRAQDLAASILIERAQPDAEQVLPHDVFMIVAEILAGDNDLPAIAALNRTSRAIHEATLPTLYEKVRLEDERSIETSITATVPKGFKYCKFLFVTEMTIALLRMHLRQKAYHVPESSTDLRQLFPQLIMLGVTQETSRGLYTEQFENAPPLHVTLYRPLSVPEIMRAALPCAPDGLKLGISFFGANFYRRIRNRRTPRWFRDIVGLTVMPGACLLPARGQVGMEDWHDTPESGPEYTLEIKDEASAPGIQNTLQIVMDYLGVQLKVDVDPDLGARGRRSLQVVCHHSVFERFIHLFHSQQPGFIEVRAHLNSPVGAETIQRYTIALAEAYAQQWQHNRDRAGDAFAEIIALAYAMPKEWIDDPPHDRHPTDACTAIGYGELIFGTDAENGRAVNRLQNSSGFTASVLQSLLFDGRNVYDELLWSHIYNPGEQMLAARQAVAWSSSDDSSSED